MTEDDTFKILKRKPVMEIYREWMSNDIEFYSNEGYHWFKDRGWTGNEWYDTYLDQPHHD